MQAVSSRSTHNRSPCISISKCRTGSIADADAVAADESLHFYRVYRDEWVECLAHTEISPALDYYVYLCFLVWPNFFISHILTPSKVLFLKHSCKPFKNCFKCEYLLKLEFHPLYTINSFIHSYSHWASPFLLFLYEIVKTVCWIAYWNQMLYWKYSYSKVFFLSIVVIIIVHIRVRVCVCIRFEYTIVCLLYVYNT